MPLEFHKGPIQPFMTRFTQNPTSDRLIDESWSWEWIGESMSAGESRWARCPVHFVDIPGPSGDGFIFVTDIRVYFCPRARTDVFDLADIVGVGLTGDRKNEFEVRVSGPVDHDLQVAMLPKDLEAFRDFLPTLVYAARSAAGTL